MREINIKDKGRIEEIENELINHSFYPKSENQIREKLTSFEHSIRTEVDKEWREKIKNVKYDYPKSENQKEHERNIDIIERTVNQIKNQLLQ